MSDTQLAPGDQVVIPWGLDEVLGTVADVYGHEPRVHVVVLLTPDMSSYVVDEPTTVTLPLRSVRRGGRAA
jgi:hypothetical protein